MPPRGAFHRRDPQHEAVGALADVAGLDKADSDTEYIGRASTPCAIRAVFQVAVAKPAATAAIITATGNTLCRRSRNAATQSATAAAAATDSTGS